jgi:hypothetical protein
MLPYVYSLILLSKIGKYKDRNIQNTQVLINISRNPQGYTEPNFKTTALVVG